MHEKKMALLVALALALSCAEAKHAATGNAPAVDAGEAAPVVAATTTEPARIEDVAFVEDRTRGPRVLVRGSDARGQIEWLHLEFFDDRGIAVTSDDDGDGVEDTSVVDVIVNERAKDGRFFVEVQSARGFDAKARQVIVSPVGGMADAADKHVAVLATPSSRALGQSCDPQGFDACVAGAVCAPGKLGATNKCVSLDDTRGARCADAPRFPSGVTSSLTLDVWGSSAWEPPAGCASSERWGRPEAIAWLHVDRDAPRITLAAAGESQALDTVLSVFPGCGASSEALACNDDDEPPASRVVMRDVKAGDYLVVVDTLDRSGGRVTVRATTW